LLPRDVLRRVALAFGGAAEIGSLGLLDVGLHVGHVGELSLKLVEVRELRLQRSKLFGRHWAAFTAAMSARTCARFSRFVGSAREAATAAESCALRSPPAFGRTA